jgi:hypothetical protein
MGMLAHLDFDPQTDEQRRTLRRTLRLDVEGGATATVRNLSESGLLIESSDALEVGDRVSLALPVTGVTEARVIWARAPFYGCEFARPVSRAVVSAALLRAPIEEPPVVLLGPADTTWQMSDETAAHAAASLAVLATAISCLVLALASFPMA